MITSKRVRIKLVQIGIVRFANRKARRRLVEAGRVRFENPEECMRYKLGESVLITARLVGGLYRSWESPFSAPQSV